jgi:RNA polymerase sigma factor (sigma-70 family)
MADHQDPRTLRAAPASPPAIPMPTQAEADVAQLPSAPQSGTADPGHDTTSAPSRPSPDLAEVTAFSEFYRESVPRLVIFLRVQGASLAEAADCVQETMIQALPPKWATLDTPYAWCRTVASRTYFKRVADRREDPMADVGMAGYPLIAPGADITVLEQHHEVLRLFDRLPPRQRQVMAWTYDGVKPAEIAQELDMNPQTVRATLRDARKNLLKMRDSTEGRRSDV